MLNIIFYFLISLVFFIGPTYASDQASQASTTQSPVKKSNTKTMKPSSKHKTKTPPADNKLSNVLDHYMLAGNKNFKVRFHGILNQLVFYANDGKRSRIFYGNNANYPTGTSALFITANAEVNTDLTLFSAASIELANGGSNVASQINPAPSPQLILTRALVGIESKSYGTLSLGEGETLDNWSEDLSGTVALTKSASVSSLGGSMIFNNSSTGSLTGNPTVGGVFKSLNSLVGSNRIRYGSPLFAGFRVGASLIENNQRDIGFEYSSLFHETLFKAVLVYANSSTAMNTAPGPSLDGSASILFKNGFNASIAAGEVFITQSQRSTPIFVYLKPGYQMHLTTLGNTNVAIDYGIFNNFVLNNDKGQTYGAVLVQDFKKWDTQLYFGYRFYKLNRPSTPFDNINIVTTGAKISF